MGRSDAFNQVGFDAIRRALEDGVDEIEEDEVSGIFNIAAELGIEAEPCEFADILLMEGIG